MFWKKRKKNKSDGSVEASGKNTELVLRRENGKSFYITIEEDIKVKPEKYYADKAKLFNFARYAVTAVLVAFILIMFGFFGDEFAGENFRYLIKHIDMNSSGIIDEFKTVVYDSADGTVFCEYQQDFVIAAPGSLKIYDYKGVMTLNSLPSTEKPRLCSSARYILLYDSAGKDYYVYNSFSLLRQRECENKIITADMSDSGVFVIVTESLEYAAHIYVYNDNFDLINEIKKNNTVVDVCLSQDGKMLAVTTIDVSENAELVSKLTVYGLEESSVIFEKSINAELPVSVEFDGTDAVNVMTTEKFRFYDMQGNERSLAVNQSSVALFATSANLCAYSCSGDAIYKNTVYLVDSKEGNVVSEILVDRKIKSLGVGGEYVYILTEDSLYRCDKQGNTDIISLTAPVCMVVSPEGNVFVCYDSRADLIKFPEQEDNQKTD